jgi:hypothetical protein
VDVEHGRLEWTGVVVLDSTKPLKARKGLVLPAYLSPDQINTCVWLRDLSSDLGRPATLDNIPGSGCLTSDSDAIGSR